jgi:hypothetical protein
VLGLVHGACAVLEVKDKNVAGATLLGECMVNVEQLLNSRNFSIDGPQALSVNGKQKKVELSC